MTVSALAIDTASHERTLSQSVVSCVLAAIGLARKNRLADAPMDHTDSIQVETKIGSLLRGVAGLLAYLILLAISFAIILGIALGGLWLASKLLPVAEWLASIGFIALVPLLLTAIVRKWRMTAGLGLQVVAFVWAIALWLWSILALFDFWGSFAIILGFILTPLLAVPIALLVLLFHGQFADFFWTLLTALLTLGVYFIGSLWAER